MIIIGMGLKDIMKSGLMIKRCEHFPCSCGVFANCRAKKTKPMLLLRNTSSIIVNHVPCMVHVLLGLHYTNRKVFASKLLWSPSQLYVFLSVF